MCSGKVEQARMSGSGKGKHGWFSLESAQVVYDHPFHAPLEDALIVHFVNRSEGIGARVSVELSAESARDLIRTMEAALQDGLERHGRGPGAMG